MKIQQFSVPSVSSVVSSCFVPQQRILMTRPRRTPVASIMEINRITAEIIDGAMKVHSALGPGVLESAYQACLAYELRKRGLDVQTQVPLPLIYEGVHVEIGYRIDFLIEGLVVVETKAVRQLLPIHEAQLLSHLTLSGRPVGLLINFHVMHLKDGIKRMINKRAGADYRLRGEES